MQERMVDEINDIYQIVPQADKTLAGLINDDILMEIPDLIKIGNYKFYMEPSLYVHENIFFRSDEPRYSDIDGYIRIVYTDGNKFPQQLNIDIDKIWIIKKDTREVWEGGYTKEGLFSESIPYWQNHLRRRFHGPNWGSILVDIVVRLIDGNGNTCMLKVLNVGVRALS